MIGTVLDKFEVLQKIGEGGMATVYRGRHTSLGRDVAIKVLHPHLSRSGRNRQRFAREARAIEHLSHHNILEIYDYSGTDVDDCYIVTEFVDGANLQQLIAEHGRLPSEVVLQIGLQLTAALDYAHSLGIIHRDLKPENVMLRRDGTIKLMDFGIARFLDDVQLTLTGALVGSPAYMSPEQAMEKVLDIRSDLFSLGTLLFHLVAGELPFSGTNPSIILRNIIDGNRADVLALAPATGAQLAETIEQLLHTNPDLRPQEAIQVHQALQSELDSLDLSPPPQGWEVRDWLEDPQNYEERRQTYLRSVLLEKGKVHLNEGKQLDALRLLNRLLAIDEDNEEVLELIRGMHDFAEPRESQSQNKALLLGLATILAAAGFTYVLWPSSDSSTSAPPAPSEATVALADSTIGNGLEPSQEGIEEPFNDLRPVPNAIEPKATISTEALVTKDSEQVLNPEGEYQAPSKSDAETNKPTVSTIDAPNRTIDTTVSNQRAQETRETGSAATTQPITTGSGNQEEARLEQPPEPNTTSVVAAETGYLTITIANLEWGDIYIDGQHRGRTGRDYNIAVSPGLHHIRVANGQFRSAEAQIEIVSGEPFELNLAALWPNPATAVLKGFAGDCIVQLDQSVLGTAQTLGHQFPVKRPDQVHNVQITCDSKTHTEKLEGHAALSTIVIQHPGP